MQRVPVRILLDPEDLKSHPLRVGLSMDVEVDVGQQDGEALTQAVRSEPAWSTRAFEPAHDDVDAMIKKIIEDNLAS
ncbi:Multidrug export protein EmrA [compost metagenome]